MKQLAHLIISLYSIFEKRSTIFKPLFLAKSVYFHCLPNIYINLPSSVMYMLKLKIEAESKELTSKMGRTWSTSSLVSPWRPRLRIVWCPTTIFHVAVEFSKAKLKPWYKQIFSVNCCNHNFWGVFQDQPEKDYDIGLPPDASVHRPFQYPT